MNTSSKIKSRKIKNKKSENGYGYSKRDAKTKGRDEGIGRLHLLI